MSGTSSCFFCKNVDFKKLTQYWGIGHTSSLLQPFFCDIQTANCLRWRVLQTLHPKTESH